MPSESGTNELTYRFVSTWRLTAILGPNYAGTQVPNPPNDEKDGDWINIKYEPVFSTNAGVDPRFEQITYPAEIITPTHRAVFETAKRYDIDLGIWHNSSQIFPQYEERYFHKYLKSITLYRREFESGTEINQPGMPTAKVSFSYLPNGATTLDWAEGDQQHEEMLSKLALEKIVISGIAGGQQIDQPAYVFDYNRGDRSWTFFVVEAEQDRPMVRNYQDQFGFYDSDWFSSSHTPDIDAPSWSLTKITYPEGGSHTIQYESDEIGSLSLAYDHYNFTSGSFTQDEAGNFSRPEQGGARVNTIIEDDGFETRTIEYAYGTGYPSGVPEIWFRKQTTAAAPLYFSGDRDQHNVTYSWVEQILKDGQGTAKARTRRYYDVSSGPSHQMLYTEGDIRVIVFEGNENVGWGELIKVTHFNAAGTDSVKEEQFSYSYLGDSADNDKKILARVAAPFAYVNPTPGQTDPIYLHFAHRQLDGKTTRFNYGGDQVVQTEAFTYNDGTLPEKQIADRNDGWQRIVMQRYAHDVSSSAPYATMRDKNMRRQTAQQSVTRFNPGTLAEEYHSSIITAWAAFNGLLLPSQEYQWRKTQFQTTPIFQFDGTTPPAAGGWILTRTYDDYDEHGNLEQTTGANGGETQLFWDADFQEAVIDKVEREPEPALVLTTDYDYDPDTFQLIKITDPNGHDTEFQYDELQRLTAIIDPNANTVSALLYKFARDLVGNDQFDPTKPNYIQSSSYRNATAVTISREYADGLGRSIQTQANEGSGAIKTGTIYDALRRVTKVTKPFSSTSQSFSSDPVAEAIAYTIPRVMPRRRSSPAGCSSMTAPTI